MQICTLNYKEAKMYNRESIMYNLRSHCEQQRSNGGTKKMGMLTTEKIWSKRRGSNVYIMQVGCKTTCVHIQDGET